MAHAQHVLRALHATATKYQKERGTWPSSLENLLYPSIESGEPYLRRLPRDPWGKTYLLKSTDDSVVFISFGADGVKGGHGKNADIFSDDLTSHRKHRAKTR